MRGDLEVASTPMSGPIQKARHFAVAQLPIKARALGVTSVRVLDLASRTVVFTVSEGEE